MREELRRGLTAAMKSRDAVALSAVRSALAAIDNAEAPPLSDFDGAAGEVARRDLDDAQMRAIVEAEINDRLGAAREYDMVGRGDAAERSRAEAEVLRAYS